MGDAVQTVNNIMANIEKWMASNPDHQDVARRTNELADLQSLIDEVEEYRAREMPIDTELGDISDLPPELVKELTLSTPSELEQRIIAIINSCDDKTANINTILVELYNRHKVIQKRRNMNNKLWRMISNKLIWSVNGEKGVYTTIKTEESTVNYDLNDAPKQGETEYDPDFEVPF